MLKKIANEYRKSVEDIVKTEGTLAGILWAMFLPIYMVSTIITNIIVGEQWCGGPKEEC